MKICDNDDEDVAAMAPERFFILYTDSPNILHYMSAGLCHPITFVQRRAMPGWTVHATSRSKLEVDDPLSRTVRDRVDICAPTTRSKPAKYVLSQSRADQSQSQQNRVGKIRGRRLGGTRTSFMAQSETRQLNTSSVIVVPAAMAPPSGIAVMSPAPPVTEISAIPFRA